MSEKMPNPSELMPRELEKKSVEEIVEEEIKSLFGDKDIEGQLMEANESINDAVDRILLQLKVKNGIHEGVSQEEKTKFQEEYPIEKVKGILMESIKEQQS
ncbi:MAG: hypothetical protein ACD_14C00046G0002 [uncultured bacterium]|nr:MAG: hypothetical protein ACD_14C00046G0002 [uncultured bacterium]